MAEELIFSPQASRETRYTEVLPQIEAVIEGETDLIANLANIAAILKEAFGFFWVGFYRRIGNELILGPFQGPLACTRIAIGKGVCGASAQRRATVLVPNVHEFPGHIACSSLSKSEIVVPLVKDNETLLILDVDSDQYNDFSDVDVRYLEQLMTLIQSHLY